MLCKHINLIAICYQFTIPWIFYKFQKFIGSSLASNRNKVFGEFKVDSENNEISQKTYLLTVRSQNVWV